MSMKAIAPFYLCNQLLAPVAKTATFTSTAQDFANVIENEIVIFPGLWTDGTHTFTINDSPDSTTWTSVTSTYLVFTNSNTAINAITSTASAVVQRFSYIGPQRYLQLISTIAASTTGAIYGLFTNLRYRKLPV